MFFTIFQIEKTPFQAVKTRSTVSRKIDIFPKGLTQGFGPNVAIFPTFFLGNIGQENDFYDIVERKNAFLGYKNKKCKIFSKLKFFQRGFPTFFQTILVRKMPFQAIKTRSSRIQKIDIFPKGLTHGFRPTMAIFPTFFFRHSRLGK